MISSWSAPETAGRRPGFVDRSCAVKVRVLFFAVLRERVRLDEDTLALPEGATAARALASIAEAHPSIGPLLSRVQIAVNRKVVGPHHVLCEGDEVALLPPVAGGSEPLRVAVLSTPLSLDAALTAVEMASLLRSLRPD